MDEAVLEETKAFLDKSIAEIDELRAAMQKAVEEKFAEVLGPCVQKILDAAELDGFYIYGYTASFCDGEPCEHGTYTGDLYYPGDSIDFTQDDWQDRVELEGSRCARMSEEQELEAIKYSYAIEQRGRPVARLVNDFVYGLSDTFEQVYGTDWFIIFRRGENGVEVDKGEYEPDY